MPHEHLKSFIVSLCVSVLIFVILNGVFGLTGAESPAQNVLLQFGKATVSLLVGFGLDLFAIRNEIVALYKLHATTNADLRKALGAFQTHSIEAEIGKRQELVSPSGTVLDRDELERLVSSCFSVIKGTYHGSDSNVPSEFNKLYRGYVETQIGRRQSSLPLRDVRFLFATSEQLQQDYSAHPVQFTTFDDWHSANSIRLLVVQPEDAAEYADTHGMFSTDIGVFEWEFIVHFRPILSGQAPRYRVQMQPLNEAQKAPVRQYLTMLNRVAYELRIKNSKVVLRKRDSSTIQADLDRLLS